MAKNKKRNTTEYPEGMGRKEFEAVVATIAKQFDVADEDVVISKSGEVEIKGRKTRGKVLVMEHHVGHSAEDHYHDDEKTETKTLEVMKTDDVVDTLNQLLRENLKIYKSVVKELDTVIETATEERTRLRRLIKGLEDTDVRDWLTDADD